MDDVSDDEPSIRFYAEGLYACMESIGPMRREGCVTRWGPFECHDHAVAFCEMMAEQGRRIVADMTKRLREFQAKRERGEEWWV